MANELMPLISEQKSLAELAQEAIRERILSSYFKPGDWLRQEELSQQLAVSHTPVREALDRLVADGLAERVPHKGVRVSSIDENEIAEIYCIRLLLEPIVARLAVIRISSGQLKYLETIIEQAEILTKLEEMSRRRQLNRKFHGVISQASGSVSLKRLTEILWNRFPFWMLYEGLHHQPRTLKRILEREIKEHRALLNAIANRDVNLIEQISASHIKGMKDDLKEVFGISSHILEEKQQQMGL
jgi:DNA-binding GntR family transcriptional regulator